MLCDTCFKGFAGLFSLKRFKVWRREVAISLFLFACLLSLLSQFLFKLPTFWSISHGSGVHTGAGLIIDILALICAMLDDLFRARAAT